MERSIFTSRKVSEAGAGAASLSSDIRVPATPLQLELSCFKRNDKGVGKLAQLFSHLVFFPWWAALISHKPHLPRSLHFQPLSTCHAAIGPPSIWSPRVRRGRERGRIGEKGGNDGRGWCQGVTRKGSERHTDNRV